VDFDSAELAEYPDVHTKVNSRELEPGKIMIDGQLQPIWDIPYTAMTRRFEELGAQRVSRQASGS